MDDALETTDAQRHRDEVDLVDIPQFPEAARSRFDQFEVEVVKRHAPVAQRIKVVDGVCIIGPQNQGAEPANIGFARMKSAIHLRDQFAVLGQENRDHALSDNSGQNIVMTGGHIAGRAEGVKSESPEFGALFVGVGVMRRLARLPLRPCQSSLPSLFFRLFDAVSEIVTTRHAKSSACPITLWVGKQISDVLAQVDAS